MQTAAGYDASLDNPVEDIKDDAFNRRLFSERLAATIAGLPSGDGSPVLGLYGKWGYGKSTVLNFVQFALKEQEGDRFVIFPFNPWLLRDQTALLEEFFAGLAAAFDTAIGKKNGAIAETMARYGGAFSAVPLVGGALAAFVKGAGEQMAADTIAKQRERLVEAMRQSERKVVVLIDDLDRLDRDEVLTMLKLVRLSANFPNVIYLLAFDECRVARLAATVSGASGDDGRQFLEKIVQYPFALPAVGAKRLARYVVGQVKSACDAAAIDVDEDTWGDFRALCRDVLLGALTTPRQAVRYANALRFALPLLKDEVDPYDQMIVEAARILAPELYELLRDQPDPTKIAPGLDTRGRTLGPMDEALLSALCRFERRSPKKISDPRYHDRYFSYAVAADDLSDTELADLIGRTPRASEVPVAERLATLFEMKFDSLIERLTASLERMDLVGADRLALALAPMGAQVPGAGPICDREEAHELAELIGKLSVHMLGLRSTRGKQVAGPVLEAAAPVSFALLVWNEMQRAMHAPDNKTGTLETETLWADLIVRVRHELVSRPLTENGRDTFRLLQFWQNSRPDDLRSHIAERVARDPVEALALLELFPDVQVNYDSIAEMCDPALILRMADPLIAGDLDETGLSDTQIAAGRSFKREYERRRIANAPNTR